MPYYNRRYYQARRRRRYWRNRPRKTFFRRLWRRKPYYRYRRRYSVRNKKRKLPFLRLKQWNPPYINKLKVQGIIPLFITTSERLVNNFSMYWYEQAPHYVPGGGGFSIICFTLSAFYQLFEKCQCYWTKSNNELPLIRFLGGTIKLYRSDSTDYITTYHSCFPLKPSLDTYNSTQPAILTLNKRHRIVQCKKNNPKKKPYTRLKIKPPAPIKNKWFFQQELADTPLCMLMTSAMSLDRYFSSSTSISQTIGFKCLDSDTFQYHNWELTFTSGYKPAPTKYLWALNNGSTLDYQKEKVKNLIFLGDTKNMKLGKTVIETKRGTENFSATWDRYIITEAEWGNPFEPKYLTQEVTVLITNIAPSQIKQSYGTSFNENTELGALFTTPTKKLIQECRYNPYQDSGNNHIFITSVTKREQQPWQLPSDSKYIGSSLPLWISTWGFIDYEKNTIGRNVDTDFVFVIVSDFISPKMGYYIPIDEDFLNGRSKYQPEGTQPAIYDKLHWHPKVVMQLSTINLIGSSGPGTVKLPKNISVEAHARFTFYFKLGGCGPTTNSIEDPKDQPTFSYPNNFFQTTSLQSPTFPLEHFIYSFDKRRDYFTKKATKRMQKIITSKTTIPSITDSNYFHRAPTPQETSSESSEEEETQTKTLLFQLQQQRIKQHKFRQRILDLIQQLNTP
nr:MAG: ORF1 [TTV-like mini virus]